MKETSTCLSPFFYLKSNQYNNIMKYFISLLTFFIFFSKIGFTCSCENVPSFCQSTVEVSQHETGLVFLGEFIEAQEASDFYGIAKKFRIVEILSGEIILPNSPQANDNEFENNAEEVWVLSGESATCLYEMQNGLGIFSVYYGEWFGYSPSICANNYLPVDENMNVSGTLFDPFEWETIAYQELISIIKNNGCVTSTNDFNTAMQAGLQLQSNIFSSAISFSLSNVEIDHLEVEILNAMGQIVIAKKVEQAAQNKIETHKLASGIYFLSFVKDRHRYTVKMIKQ